MEQKKIFCNYYFILYLYNIVFMYQLYSTYYFEKYIIYLKIWEMRNRNRTKKKK